MAGTLRKYPGVDFEVAELRGGVIEYQARQGRFL